jgi:hypothetical protein
MTQIVYIWRLFTTPGLNATKLDPLERAQYFDLDGNILSIYLIIRQRYIKFNINVNNVAYWIYTLKCTM